jgi:hypothetical protein
MNRFIFLWRNIRGVLMDNCLPSQFLWCEGCSIEARGARYGLLFLVMVGPAEPPRFPLTTPRARQRADESVWWRHGRSRHAYLGVQVEPSPGAAPDGAACRARSGDCRLVDRSDGGR